MKNKMLLLLVSGVILTISAGTAWADEIEGRRGERMQLGGPWSGNQNTIAEKINSNTELTDTEKEKLLNAYEAANELRERSVSLMKNLKEAATDDEKETLQAEIETLKDDMKQIMEPLKDLEYKLMPGKMERGNGRFFDSPVDLSERIQSDLNLTEEQEAAILAAWEQAKPLWEELASLKQQYLEADAADKEVLRTSMQELQVEIKDILAPTSEYLKPYGQQGPRMRDDADGKPEGMLEGAPKARPEGWSERGGPGAGREHFVQSQIS